jgi:hypothetical protein
MTAANIPDFDFQLAWDAEADSLDFRPFALPSPMLPRAPAPHLSPAQSTPDAVMRAGFEPGEITI